MKEKLLELLNAHEELSEELLELENAIEIVKLSMGQSQAEQIVSEWLEEELIQA